MPGWAVAVVCVAFPALFLVLRDRPSLGILRKLNPIIVCYLAGILMANTHLVGEGGAEALDLASTVAVALSIPLLLFSVDLRRIASLSGRAGLSMLLAALSVMIMATAAHLTFHNVIGESAGVGGLVVGVYTGGTLNLAAIRTALGVSDNVYLAVHTADMIFSALYLLFVMSVAKPLLSRFLRAYRAEAGTGQKVGPPRADLPDAAAHVGAAADAYAGLFARKNLAGLAKALGLALAAVAVGGSVMLLPLGESSQVWVILALTTVGLASSFIPAVRRQPMTYPLGQFVILVFCVAVGALGDLSILLKAAPGLFGYVAMVLFGSFLVHVLLCRLAGVDVDTLLVTSTSAICSPPFVGITASAVGNRDLIVPGITTGILGYAGGTYLGVLMAKLLSML